MHPETIHPPTRKCLALLGRESWLKSFYLAGGTGLALLLGHRISEDLDFFSEKPVDEKKLRSLLAPLGHLKIEMEKEGTLWATLDNTKISFFQYEYPLIDMAQTFEGVSIAGIKDIACMKLDTISSRGSRKDFVDLYFITKQSHSLKDVLNWFHQKYKGIDFNRAHLLKSLSYFEDADKDKDLKMLLPCKWEEVKRTFEFEVGKII